MLSSEPNKVDYIDTTDFPTNPDTINYNYVTGTYNPPRPFESSYEKTNYDITNFPRTDYIKFNSDTTNYDQIPEVSYPQIDSSNMVQCQSPDMLYQVPRDPQYLSVQKYMCFDTKNKLLELSKDDQKTKWTAEDLSNSPLRIKWQGSQCKIITPNICSNDKLTENCEATCFINNNETINIKYKSNIWRVPKLEEKAGACSMTAISEDTAQNSYCKCTVLERPVLKTKAVKDDDRSGKYWCST